LANANFLFIIKQSSIRASTTVNALRIYLVLGSNLPSCYDILPFLPHIKAQQTTKANQVLKLSNG